MGLLGDLLNPGPASSGVGKPLMLALGALAVGKMVSAHHANAAAAQPATGAANGTPLGGALASGLGGLLSTLQGAGHGDAVNSWLGNGPNKPIQPTQLGAALGPNTVKQLAQHSGLNEQELLTQLSSALPGIVDKLSQNGTIPNVQQLESMFLSKH
ncbi:YidB family protein [Chelativorans sp. AA-79]|uniref:YidB family protein n=1 Tax=Chelativorans sp. AA-79 TaxID=3028735 RepID=UPI0023F9BBC0|nr:YidB family protein [Chelativorans sp. AA-79]WEX10456.1 YidB family protein [Chelativorans sp. AA-79]